MLHSVNQLWAFTERSYKWVSKQNKPFGEHKHSVKAPLQGHSVNSHIDGVTPQTARS